MKLLVLIFCLNLNPVVIKGWFEPKCPANTFNGTSIKLCNDRQWCKIIVANECIFGNNSEFSETNAIYFMDKINVIREGALQNFESLRRIIIKSVGLTKIKPGSFISIPNISVVSVSYNEIKKVILETFSGLNCEYLLLTKNKISIVDSDAFAIQRLKYLNLNGNKLKTFDQKWFGENSRLHTLYLESNLIKSLKPYSFNKLKDLRVIGLNNNFMTRIEKNTFHGIKKIDWIQVRNNSLETIEVNAIENEIRYLDLSTNKLKYFSKGFFNHLEIDILVLLPNPWMCKCLDEIYFQLKDKKTKIVLSGEWKNNNNNSNNSYPICVVPLIEKSQLNSCTEDFVKTVRNDRIFNEFFSVLGYDRIAKT